MLMETACLMILRVLEHKGTAGEGLEPFPSGEGRIGKRRAVWGRARV
jgi:hypothetical protein